MTVSENPPAKMVLQAIFRIKIHKMCSAPGLCPGLDVPLHGFGGRRKENWRREEKENGKGTKGDMREIIINL